MTVSNNQWASPAHVDDFLMDVDDRRHPHAVILRRRYTPVLTLPISTPDELPAKADDLVANGAVARGVANQLVMQLAAKLAVTEGRP